MLHLLDDALGAFLRAELGPASSGLDVAFALPDREWSSALNRPTLNLFLHAVDPHGPDTAAGMQHVEQDGRPRRRPALPRMVFTYLVTAWVADVRDEHRLLGALLAVLARTRDLTPPHLPEALAAVEPWPTLRLGAPGDPADLWPAIGGRFHPALTLVVAASVDPGFAEPLSPPPTDIELSVTDRREPARRDERRIQISTGRPGAGRTVRRPGR